MTTASRTRACFRAAAITGLLAPLWLVAGRSAAAQPAPDGGLRGTVRDQIGHVLVGATVVVEGDDLIGGSRSGSTGQDGTWRLPALPPGTYRVRAAAEGFQTGQREGIVLEAGLTLTVDFVLALVGIVESKTVEAGAPLVDVTSAAVPANINVNYLTSLPTSRVFADLINLVPGVSGDVAFGGSKRSNAIYVEGVDTTTPSEQDPWLRFNQNWLEEVQVVGLGANAEHGDFTGVASYARVRSGANRFSGLAEYWDTRSGWVADNTGHLSTTLQETFAPERTDAYWNLNGQVGGPVRRDRTWFFAGIEHTTRDYTPAGYAGPEWRQERDTLGLAKVTAAAGPVWLVEGFAQGGSQRTARSALGRSVLPEAAGRTEQPQFSWSTRATGTIGQVLLVGIQYAGYESPSHYVPETPGSVEGPSGHYDLAADVYSVNVLEYSHAERARHTVSATGTWYAQRFLGRTHEFKFGAEIERSHERSINGFPGGVAYLDYAAEPYLAYLGGGGARTARTTQVGLFVQDVVQVASRVTLLPGLRVDWLRGAHPADTVLETSPVSPRFGVAWDVRGDHHSVVRAHYGRYADPIFSQPVLDADSTDPDTLVIVARVVGPGQFEEVSRYGGTANATRIDPRLRQSRVDQWVVGAEQQVGSNLAVQAHYVHRRFGDFMAYSTPGATWTPVQRQDPGPDGILGTPDDGPVYSVYSLANVNTARVYTNPGDAWRRLDVLQLVARKRLAGGWQAQVSYTRSRATGTVGNAFHANSGVRGKPWGNPNVLINAGGRLSGVPSNELKALGTWRAPWLGGFTFGAVYRYTTGAAWARTFQVRGLRQGPERILAEPVGTRRVDAINNLDLRVEKILPLGRTRRLGLFADVFNVTNQGVPDSDWVITVNGNSGPSLGEPITWRAPRQLRVALRVTF